MLSFSYMLFHSTFQVLCDFVTLVFLLDLLLDYVVHDFMPTVQRNGDFRLFVEPNFLKLLNGLLTLRVIKLSQELFVSLSKVVYNLFLTHLFLLDNLSVFILGLQQIAASLGSFI